MAVMAVMAVQATLDFAANASVVKLAPKKTGQKALPRPTQGMPCMALPRPTQGMPCMALPKPTQGTPCMAVVSTPCPA